MTDNVSNAASWARTPIAASRRPRLGPVLLVSRRGISYIAPAQNRTSTSGRTARARNPIARADNGQSHISSDRPEAAGRCRSRTSCLASLGSRTGVGKDGSAVCKDTFRATTGFAARRDRIQRSALRTASRSPRTPNHPCREEAVVRPICLEAGIHFTNSR